MIYTNYNNNIINHETIKSQITNHKSQRLLTVTVFLSLIVFACKKEPNFQSQVESRGSGVTVTNSRETNSTFSVDNLAYVTFGTQEEFEYAMLRTANMSPTQLEGYRDSLVTATSMVSLSTTLPANDTLWTGAQNLVAILNQYQMVQIGDSVIRLDVEQNKAYVLTPVNDSFLVDLKNKQVITNQIYEQTNLEEPMLKFKFNGVLCWDQWADKKSQVSYSWDNWAYGGPGGLPANGTQGVKWEIRYHAYGLWFCLKTHATVVETDGSTIFIPLMTSGKYICQTGIQVDGKVRCLNNVNKSLRNQNTYALHDEYAWTDWAGVVALRDYEYTVWAAHKATSGGSAYRAFLFPMYIESN